MKTMVKIYLEDENKTKEIGYKLGNLLTPGSVICLIGDLGAGKTTMTQSLAKALEVDDYITSPTFTIVNEYEGKMPLYHFDVYRIGSSDEMYDIGYEEYINGEGVCIIEWANLIEDILPDEYLYIDLDHVRVSVKGQECPVTPTECRLLRQFLMNRGQLLTYDLLLERLWDSGGQFVDKHTLAVNVNRLRGKIEDKDHRYISNVYGMGYQWIG